MIEIHQNGINALLHRQFMNAEVRNDIWMGPYSTVAHALIPSWDIQQVQSDGWLSPGWNLLSVSPTIH